MTNSFIFASLTVLIGIIVGVLLCHILLKQDEKSHKHRLAGEIQIDNRDKKTDVFRIVWYEDPSNLTRETYVTFKVNPNAKLREKGNDYSD